MLSDEMAQIGLQTEHATCSRGQHLLPFALFFSRSCQVAYEWGHFSPDFERRVLERAYFQYMNGVSEDEVYNYFEALRIELGQRPADL